MIDPTQSFRAAILAALGHAPETIEPGRFVRFATSNRRGDSAGWCKLFADQRGGIFGCMRRGLSETWTAADRSMTTREQRATLAHQVMAATAERETLQRQQWAENARRIARICAESRPLVGGDPVTLYLKRRGFAGVWPLPEVLRLHGAMPYWHEGEKLGAFAAMVAPLVAPDGRTVALHRTYLTADGRKADVPSPKKLTGTAGPLAGACIPLHKPAQGCIGIGEGIETSLAASLASAVPTVAAYCAGSLAAWRWPVGVHRLVIFADADKAGREAAESLQLRAVRAGLQCSVMTPSESGTDWADVWAQRVEAEAAV
jgi:phage/plasmid primase-like uncharacterized protein